MIEDHSQYLLNTYARPPLLFTRGKGCKLYATSPTNPRFNSASGSTSTSTSTSNSTEKKKDEDEEVEYLDFTAGIAVNALGHADPQIASLLSEQAGRLSHSSNVCWNEWAGELGRLLVHQTREHGGLGLTKGGHEGAKVFFTNSGTESNEGALKFARLIGKNRQSNSSGKEKTALVCFNNAFHGRSMGALSVTPNPKYQAPFSPLIPNVRVGQLGDKESLEELVTEDVCGVIVEPIQGEGGLNEANREWFEALGRRCREVGAVLIYDEIQVSRGVKGRVDVVNAASLRKARSEKREAKIATSRHVVPLYTWMRADTPPSLFFLLLYPRLTLVYTIPSVGHDCQLLQLAVRPLSDGDDVGAQRFPG
jgi:acetylornithine aminotransferase